MQDAGKGDADVAASLRNLQLKEPLTSAEAAKLEQYLPGDLSQNQLAVLRGLSAFEPAPPPASAPPAPDAAAQSAMLARTGSWLMTNIEQSPSLRASKAIVRYRADASNTAASYQDQPVDYVKTPGGHTEMVEISHGAEKELNSGPRIHWGENGEISEGGPLPTLPELFHEASAFGKLSFTRWEEVHGVTAAVFSFEIPKKKSHYAVDYCCFANVESASASQGTGGDNILGQPNVMNVSTWKPYNKKVPYHGLLYIDPPSGAILRIVIVAELRPFDFVHAEQTRIDYGTETVNGKKYEVPLHSIAMNETVPGGDTKPTVYPVRRGLTFANYSSYQADTH